MKLEKDHYFQDMRKKLTIFDPFAGVGGLGLGVADAGMSLVSAVEISRDAANTLK